MPDITTTVEVTELEEFTPTRVDGVGKGANGFPFLMLKAIGDDVEEIPLTLTTDELLDEVDKASDGAAASGADVAPPGKCPTCNGSGTLPGNGKGEPVKCVDCDGTGEDSTAPSEDQLHRIDADGGSIVEGAGGRETVDKAEAEDKDASNQSGGSITDAEFEELMDKAVDDSDEELMKDWAKWDAEHGGGNDKGHFVANDKGGFTHKSDAAAKMFGAGSKQHQAAIKKFGKGDVAAKAEMEKDGMSFSADNPQLQPDPNDVDNAGGDPTDPGSPSWEAMDAQALIAAGQQLAMVATMLQASRGREAQEVAAGHAEDVADVMDLSQAIACLDQCLGIVAQLAFREEAEANKSLEENDDEIEKQNRRLSRKTVGLVATARDHLSELLGGDDPSKSDTTKSLFEDFDLSKELDQMTAEELIQLLDARDAQKAADDVEKGKSAMDTADGIAGGKSANASAKKKKPKAEMDDLEDEADQGDNDSASSGATGAAKEVADEIADVELTDEQIEKIEAAHAAKKAAKAAKKAVKQAAENAAIAKALEESKAGAEKAVLALQEQLAEMEKSAAEREKAAEERLATVEKMAAPGAPVKIVPPDAVAKSAERDVVELEISKFENLAKNTPDRELRQGYTDAARKLRLNLSAKTTA